MRRKRRDALVCAHIGLVAPIARAIGAGLPACFDPDDLIAAGHLGLIRAAERYRPRAHAGTPFGLFARSWIRGAILSSVRAHWSDGTGHHALRPLAESLPADVSGAWRADGPDEPAINEAIDAGRRVRSVVSAIGMLPAEQKQVLEAVYAPGSPTVRAAAAGLGIAPARAYRLHASGIGALRTHFGRC